MDLRLMIITLVAVSCTAGAGIAADREKRTRPVKQATEPVTFKAVADLSYDLAEPKLRGGRPADPKQFRASFYSSSNVGMCTSALVGPRVLLTAAHCVPRGGTVKIGMGQQTWTARCTHHAEYPGNATADWALCALDSVGPKVPYERVNLDAALLKVKDELQLAGFGCTNDDGTGGNDGIYRIGEAPVRYLPVGPDYDIVTQATAALCFGDSGGPSFRYNDAARKKRVVVGVNSRVGVDANDKLTNTSYLSSTSAAREFFSKWSTEKNVKICGIHADAVGCHE